MYATFVQYVLECFDNSLCCCLDGNEQLVYTLVYHRQLFSRYISDPRFSGVCANLHRVCSRKETARNRNRLNVMELQVIDYFSTALEAETLSGGVSSPEAVLQVIRARLTGWHAPLVTVRVHTAAPCAFTHFDQARSRVFGYRYEEVEDSYRFFVPFAWSVAFNARKFWQKEHMALLAHHVEEVRSDVVIDER